jgi:O-acetylhomoserine (thiol)-lyase
VSDPSTWGFETRQIHAGQQPDSATGARALPIYQTTAYVFDSTEHAANLFALKEFGNIYTRIMNPTQDAVEQRIAALEGGVGALLVASGQSATTLGLLNIAEAGDHIVASAALYGGTFNLLRYTFAKLGVQVSFVEEQNDPEAWRAAVQPNTKAFFGESIANPKADVLDIRAVADVAHEVGVPFVVDNTIATPYLLRPIEHGADIVLHSITKFLGGHGTALGGVIVDGGRFDWMASDKFPTLTEPYAGYHGLVFAEEFGPAALGMRARAEGLRDFGACMSPHNAFALLQGIETLPLRMARHVSNTDRVLQMLQANDAVTWVKHPRVPTHPDHDLAARLYPKGAGAILSFGVKGGRAAGRKFIEAVQLATHLANVGDAKTLVIHPASTTHQQLSDAEQRASGVKPELIRVSVGIEHIDDIREDFAQALAAQRCVCRHPGPAHDLGAAQLCGLQPARAG